MTRTFLYDTYALIEMMKRNPNYEEYLNEEIIINNFIFSEFCYKLFRENIKNAEEYINEVEYAIMDVESRVIEEAMRFRVVHKKKKLSMTDCISYIMAQNLGIKFLTGDKEFEKFDGVEFVK